MTQLWQEPRITINGVELSDAEAMTVRVAVATFLMEMGQPGALGDDELGRSIAEGYKRACIEINMRLVSPRR